MKRIITLLLCALMLLSLAACGSSSASQEPSKEETAETEAPVEETKEPETTAEPEPTAAPETNDDMVERTVGDAFRFMVPKDWEKQENGSYMVDSDRGPINIFFLKLAPEEKGYALPEGFSIESEDLAEVFIDYMNEAQVFQDVTMKLYNADEGVQETANGLRYRHIACDVLDKDGNEVDYIILYVYEWTDDAYFSIVFDPAYSVSTVRDCIKIIHKTIERID
ncbi:MAG: hypothetical protein IKE21_08910 [Erysipelotrichaceae bacterium]|nr:hypothetical protein [Erysipelotrichaceae bacterium]